MPVTINRVLLHAFLALVVVAVVLVGSLSFYRFRNTLETEIAANLQYGAATLMQRIDAFLFERLENVRIWRRLEVMQDIRVNDVDKRLSRFLSDLQKGHGRVYRLLFCTATDNRVVAASDAAWIGRTIAPGRTWLSMPAAAGEAVVLEPMQGDTQSVALRTTVDNAFGDGRLGYFYALLDWSEIRKLLDEAVAGSAREALLLDADGNVLAVSAKLRGSGIDALNLKDWETGEDVAGPDVRAGDALGRDNLLVGGAASSGDRSFAGFGWHLLMVVPTRVAFAPVWRLMAAMVALLLLTLVAAGWAAARLSARIARPIVALTDFTRRYRKGEVREALPQPASIAEVDELTRAYNHMMTALAQSREQVVRAGKLAVVGEMAAVMAHEVRTPLGILQTSAQLLQRQPDQNEKVGELAGYILSETGRLNRLVTTLLECARPRAPDFRPQDLHAIIEQVLGLLSGRAEAREVRLERELNAAQPVLVCDREQLIQVFLNLLINALQFTPRGGRILVATHNSRRGALLASVADDGPGLPAELRERVFDPFFTRREGGIGLGLTIVQQIVQAHGGDIRVTPSASGGACFSIRFDTHDEDHTT